MQNIVIDISKRGVIPPIIVTEYDSMSRFFELRLLNNGADYTPPENANYSVWYETNDSKGWYDTITLPDETSRPAVVEDGNVLTIEIAEAATTSCGELAVMVTGDGGYQLTVSGIRLMSADVPGYDGEEVENYYNVFITEMRENAARAENAAATAIEYGATIEVDEAAQQLNITHTDNTGDVQTWVTEAEAWAVGQRDGVDVPSTDETYHNNAKYYAQAAEDAIAGIAGEVTELKNELGLSNSEIGIHYAEHIYVSNNRWAIIPFTFENGKSYYIHAFNASQNMSEVRISSAGNLNNDTKIVSWSASSTEFEKTYNCNVSNAAYLIIVTPSGNTSLTVDCTISDYDISAQITQIDTNTSNISANTTNISQLQLKVKGGETVGFQKASPIYSISGNVCTVEFYVNSANNTGFYFNLSGTIQSFSPVKHGTLKADGGYEFTLDASNSSAKALVIDTTDIDSGARQINVVTLASVTMTQIVLLTWFPADVVSPMKGVLGEYFNGTVLQGRVTTLENAMGATLYPSYYDTNGYMQGKIDDIHASAPLNGTQFAFVTDMHFASNSMSSLSLLKAVRSKTSVNAVVCGGDCVDAYGAESLLMSDYAKTYEYAKAFYPDWFCIRGNHDFTIRTSADVTTGTTLGDSETYDGIVRPMANWRYEVPTPETDFFDTENNQIKNYCWVATNEQAKVKIIAFCDFNQTNTSIYWGVTGRITNAYAKYLGQLFLACDGYTVILLTHAPITNRLTGGLEGNIITVAQAFAKKTSTTLGSYTLDFTSSTGRLALSLSGHSHKDQFDFYKDVVHVNSTCDATYNNDGYGRTHGTISECAFDIISMDVDNNTATMTRIGAGHDRIVHYNPVTVSTTETLTASLSGTVTWNSSDISVATVSSGTVTKVATGECYVTATDENGNVEYWAVVC